MAPLIVVVLNGKKLGETAAAPTEPPARLAEVMVLAAILAPVTAPAAMLAVLIAPSPMPTPSQMNSPVPAEYVNVYGIPAPINAPADRDAPD
jgi:hypothetical protein